ncbi:MAG: HDOD domain-containing protein [Planctomycetota bacterium]|nr:MAG: HDOD domain-containing protein [Planctomycetota bacterium]
MSLPDAVLEGALLHLPGCSFAPALGKVKAMARDERCPLSVLAAIIGSDPGMALSVLARAHFPGRLPPGSSLGIAAAINRLGIPATIALLDEVQVIPPHLTKPMASVWAQANAASLMVRLLANRCPPALFADPQTRELIPLCGLFAELGSTIALRIFGEQYQTAASRMLSDQGSFHDHLQAELGICPGKLAQRYLTLWGVPSLIGEAIAQQYRREDDHPALALGCLLHVSRNLTCGCGFAAGVDHFVEAIDQRALAVLNLRGNDLSPLIDEFFDEMRHLEYYEISRPNPESSPSDTRAYRRRGPTGS